MPLSPTKPANWGMSRRYLQNTHRRPINFPIAKLEFIKALSQLPVYPAPSSNMRIDAQFIQFSGFVFASHEFAFFSKTNRNIKNNISFFSLINAGKLCPYAIFFFFAWQYALLRPRNSLALWLHWRPHIPEVLDEFQFLAVASVSVGAPSSLSFCLSETTCFFFLIAAVKSHYSRILN